MSTPKRLRKLRRISSGRGAPPNAAALEIGKGGVARFRVVQDVEVHRRGAGELGDAPVHEGVDDGLGLEARMQVERIAAQDGKVELGDQAEAVEEGQDAEDLRAGLGRAHLAE
jgi:hypothetical protein